MLTGATGDSSERCCHSRFVCSTASAPSRSNTTLRTERSRASSVANESLKTTRGTKKAGNESSQRAKARSAKGKARSTKKTARKAQQPDKSLRPGTGILQNAIVLAPFHTLKRCFQNKLVDLYSYEKMKKINRKLKMAEKQNMSFEYDIVELNKINTSVKKEGKAPKIRQKLRSPSYCTCDKKTKSDPKESISTPRDNQPTQLFVPNSPTYTGHLERKRRKLNSSVLVPNILKAELSPRGNLRSPTTLLPSDTNFSGSRLSSRSKSDSSETCSNSLSCRDERLTGSLAISTTSFDSCLEHFDKPSSPKARKKPNRTKSHRSTELSPPCQNQPNADTSKHLIVHVGTTKNSDSRIVDFMDREPQPQLTSSAESTLHLQPLPRRQSKTRAKRPENPTTAGYFLRSLTPAAEPLPANRREFHSPRRSAVSKSRIEQIEVATQVEGSSQEKDGDGSSCSNIPQDSATGSGDSPPGPLEEKADAEESAEVSEPVCELMSSSAVGARESQSKELELGSRAEIGDVPLGVNSLGLSPELGGEFGGSAAVEEPRNSGFIFGPRNTENRLEESCNFSFGLNFVFSDDED